MADDPTTFSELVDGIRVAMLTSAEPDGRLRSRPLTVQRLDDDGTVWFLVDADAEWGPDTVREANLAFVDDDRWVSAAGHVQFVTDTATLDDLGDPISDAFFTDGSERAALRVLVDHADYWTGSGTLRRLIDLGAAAITGSRPDLGDRGVVQP
ncbi:MAG: pyridoxamine 5'-phosphate oxidase family protein [Actinomycetota bacterium]|nr:pyridoxamine 5'-phosphate oxidase family protein [Actinomycetota bacterium]